MSHPFACRKLTCPKCCTKFPQSSKQQDTVSSKPIATTSPSTTPSNTKGDATMTFHPSNSTHPVVTQGNRMHTAYIIYCTIIMLDSVLKRFPLVQSKATVSCVGYRFEPHQHYLLSTRTPACPSCEFISVHQEISEIK